MRPKTHCPACIVLRWEAPACALGEASRRRCALPLRSLRSRGDGRRARPPNESSGGALRAAFGRFAQTSS
eukprot:scaffold11834_cov69-Phaeocystis_antarctica.AAC.5